MAVFTRFLAVTPPARVFVDPATGLNPAFTVDLRADGDIPFPQLVIHGDGGTELLVRFGDIVAIDRGVYVATVPAGLLPPGRFFFRAEGCRTADLGHARPEDWVRRRGELRIEATPQAVAESAAPDNDEWRDATIIRPQPELPVAFKPAETPPAP